jgi:CBS domain-containing protein
MKSRRASDIMTSPVITAKKDMKVTDVINLLLRWNISSVPVVDEQGNLMGMVTEYDVLDFALDGHAAEATAGEAMSTTVVSFPPESNLEELINCSVSKRIHRMPIVKDGKVVGMVSRRDILREMQRTYSQF